MAKAEAEARTLLNVPQPDRHTPVATNGRTGRRTSQPPPPLSPPTLDEDADEDEDPSAIDAGKAKPELGAG